jgi:hypothetical protein
MKGMKDTRLFRAKFYVMETSNAIEMLDRNHECIYVKEIDRVRQRTSGFAFLQQK